MEDRGLSRHGRYSLEVMNIGSINPNSTLMSSVLLWLVMMLITSKLHNIEPH